MTPRITTEKAKNIVSGDVEAYEIFNGDAKALAADLIEAREERDRWEARTEKAEVQLAGCSVAALGGSPEAKMGDYGWNASYRDVVNLRQRCDRAEAERDEWREMRMRAENAIGEWTSRMLRTEAMLVAERNQSALAELKCVRAEAKAHNEANKLLTAEREARAKDREVGDKLREIGEHALDCKGHADLTSCTCGWNDACAAWAARKEAKP